MKSPEATDEEIFKPLTPNEQMELENLEIAPQDVILNPFTYSTEEEETEHSNMPDIQKQKLC